MHLKLIDQISSSFISEVGKEKGVFLTGYGGSMMDHLKGVDMYFTSFNSYNLDEVRNFYINLMEKYIACVNKDKRIRPYLHNFPFTSRNVKISISFVEKETGERKRNYLARVVNNEEKDLIYYYVYDPESPQLVMLHKETYPEALLIVKRSGTLQSEYGSHEPRPLLPFEKKLLN